MSRFLNLMPSARSSGVDLPRLLDLNLHRLPAPVVAAVPAPPVRQLRLVPLRALAVRGRRSLPRRSPRVPPRPARLPLRYCHGSLPSVVQLELVQDLPPGIDIRPAGALAEVAIPAAPLAQSQAVRTAQRRERHPQDHRVAHHRLEVDVALGHGGLVGLLGCTRREQLPDLDPERLLERLQAPGAPIRDPARQRPAHLDALDDGGEGDLQADRLIPACQLGAELVEPLLERHPAGPARLLQEIPHVEVNHHAPSSARCSSASVVPRSRSRPRPICCRVLSSCSWIRDSCPSWASRISAICSSARVSVASNAASF